MAIKRNKQSRDADSKVFQEGALVNLHIRCWGASASLNEEFFGEAMPPEIVRAVYDLLGDKSKIKGLHDQRDESKRYLYRYSLPFPQDGLVFILKADIEMVNEGLIRRRGIFQESVEDFLRIYDAEVAKFAQNYPALYNPHKYPTVAEMRARFKFRWTFRHFDVSGTLGVLPPSVYKEQMQSAREEIKQMVNMAVRTIGQQFLERIKSIQTQCSSGNINTATVHNLHEWLDSFGSKWDGYIGHQKLREMVAECKAYLDGVDAEDLRYGDSLRDMVANGMQGIINDFQNIADARLHRRLDF